MKMITSGDRCWSLLLLVYTTIKPTSTAFFTVFAVKYKYSPAAQIRTMHNWNFSKQTSRRYCD